MPFDLGDTVRLTAQCHDPSGALADATGVTLTLTLPDGTTASPAVTNPPAATGQYSVDYTTVQEGRHSVRWVFTSPDDAYTDALDVRAADPPLLLSLADAKKHLNITSSGNDDELRGWIETVTAGVEALAGVVVRRAVEERHAARGGVRTLALRRTPVLELTSVDAVLTGGTGYAVASLDVDEATGIMQRLDGGPLCGPLRVTYVAGRTAVPAAIRDAAKLILQHLWRTQHGMVRGPVPGPGDDYSVTEPIAGFGYAIPNRALQLLEPYRLPPGVA